MTLAQTPVWAATLDGLKSESDEPRIVLEAREPV
jgi:hypothetical protein